MTSPPVEYARREVLPPLEVRLGTSGHRPGWVGRLRGPVAVCALVTLIVLPAVMSLLFVRSYGVDVPFMDDWRNVLLLEKLYNGTITVRDLFRPANEHLTTIPYIVFLVLGYVTHYDTTTSMYASWFFIAISSIIVYASVRQALTSATRALIVFLPVTWLLFSPRQSQALLTETTMCIFL